MRARPGTFRQSDIVRALRAAKAAGLEVARYEIDHAGKVIVFTTAGETVSSGLNELDRELAEFEGLAGTQGGHGHGT